MYHHTANLVWKHYLGTMCMNPDFEGSLHEAPPKRLGVRAWYLSSLSPVPDWGLCIITDLVHRKSYRRT